MLKSRLESLNFDAKTRLTHLAIYLLIQHWKVVLQRSIQTHMGKSRQHVIRRIACSELGAKYLGVQERDSCQMNAAYISFGSSVVRRRKYAQKRWMYQEGQRLMWRIEDTV